MKAVRYHQVGGPEVLHLEEVEEPVAGPGGVRIRVRAAGGELTKRVRELTGGRGVELVLDSVGASTWKSSMESLAPCGYVISYGTASGSPRRWTWREVLEG
jgi:NADPH2:quinone reductase